MCSAKCDSPFSTKASECSHYFLNKITLNLKVFSKIRCERKAGYEMSKIAFMFPGQGAQYIGMGKEFYENSEVAKEIYEIATDVTGLDIKSICFEENDKINITEYTQVAMLTTEVALLKVLENKGIYADVCAGLSLGEYGALVCSGALSSKDAFYVVKNRGKFMQEAYPVGGGMTAVLGGDKELIEQVCEDTEGIVSIANYNCPGQIVISGEKTAVDIAAEKLVNAGVKRCIPLQVSGPFHTKLLAGAGEQLGKVLEEVEIQDLKIPYVSNTLAEYITDKEQVKPLLVRQVSESVRWEQSIRKMLENGVTTFVEIGPGKTLAGFMRKIDRSVKVLTLDKWDDLDKVVQELQ